MKILGKKSWMGSLAILAALTAGCSKSSSGSDSPVDVSGAGPLFLVTTNVETPDGSTSLIYLPNELSTDGIKAKEPIKILGGADVDYFNGNIYIGKSEKLEIQRFEITESGLQPREILSFADRGISWLSTTFVSPTRAFTFADATLQYIEWNPTTMTITKTHDLSALKKEGWGWEWRDAIYRESDGKIFFYFAYTNDRTVFLNEFTVVAFDTKTDTATILTDASCPATAGFGGYVDENNDFYAFADNFGLFTQVGATDVKQSCVLRIKNNETAFDPSFKFLPSEALGGKAPWGYYYLGNDLAFTSVVDVNKNAHESVYSLLFAPEHGGALINTKTKQSFDLPELPLSGVGFQPYKLDGSLLVARTVGDDKGGNEGVINSNTVVYRITAPNGEGKTEPLFEISGFVNNVQRIR